MFIYIQIEGRFGDLIQDSFLIKGFLINSGFNNIWIPKKLNNVVIALVSDKLNPSSIHDISIIEINNIEFFKKIQEIKKKFYNNLIISLKRNKIDLLISQWGLEENFKYLLFKNNIPVVCWVKSSNLEMLSFTTKARIIANHFDIDFSRVGFSKSVREVSFRDGTKVLIFDNFFSPKCITIFLICTKKFILLENKILIKNVLKNLSILMKNKSFLLSNGYSELVMIMTLYNLNSKYFSNSNHFLNCFIASIEVLPKILLKFYKKFPMVFIQFFKKKSTKLLNTTHNKNLINTYIEPKSIRQNIYYLTFKIIFILINTSVLLA